MDSELGSSELYFKSCKCKLSEVVS